MPRIEPVRPRLVGLLGLLFMFAALAPACTDAEARPVPAAPSNPLVGLRADASAPQRLSGVIEERLAAGSYNYLALRGADGPLRWVVVMGAAPAVGAEIRVRSHGRRRDFVSRRLGRSFAELDFVAIEP